MSGPSWPIVRLGDLVDVLDSRRVPLSAAERAKRLGRVPYYGAAGQVGWIDDALFDEDLVLLGEDGVQFLDPVKKKAYRVAGRTWVNNHAHVLRARPAVDWRYLEHYLNHFDYRGFANGTTRLKLTQGAMRQIPVALPPLDEQRRIVDILEDHLSRLDAAGAAVTTAASRTEMLRWATAARWTLRPSAPVRDVPLADLLTEYVGGVWGDPPGTHPLDVDVIRVTELKPWG